MPLGHGQASNNLLLKAIRQEDLIELKRHFLMVDLNLHEVLQEAHKPVNFLYFPTSGVCSIIALGTDGARIEAGLIGREGVVGLSVALAVDEAPFDVVVQVPGRAMRISRTEFVRILEVHPEFRKIILRYAYVFMVQTAQTALANGKLTIQQRLARWLLMCQDRVDAPEFVMTHQFLSVMLSVRRPGVTTALQTLESKAAIKSMRGKIRILDRAMLLQFAKSAYGEPEREYQRLLSVKKP